MKKSNVFKAMVFLVAFCLFLTCGLWEASGAAQFACPPNSLRVALDINLASAQFAVAQGDYELVDYMTQIAISSNPGSGVWSVAPKGGSNLQLSQDGKTVQGLVSSLVILRQKNQDGLNLFRYKGKRYRGDLLIQNINGKLFIINVIDVEQYLCGVVGPEMGFGAPDEAYRAQAVVSRTYALYYKAHPQLNYDLGITTSWQVYDGYEGEAASSQSAINAVNVTRGQVIYFDNQLIQAFFHANSGGHTEKSENVWTFSKPYLNAIAVPHDAYALQVAQNGGWPANTYEWEKTFTRQALLGQISKWNSENPQERINVGSLEGLVVSRQAVDPATLGYLPSETSSGRVTRLDFIGTQGVKSFFKDRIRSVLDLRSTLFSIFTDAEIKVLNAAGTVQTLQQATQIYGVSADGLTRRINGNNGNYYVVTDDGVKTRPKQFTALTIKGKGYGHGLGMSQWGARGMAAQGMSYRDIIEYFYNRGKNDGRLRIAPYSY